MRPGRVAVVPDRHGTGTNALLLSPPDAIGPGVRAGQLRASRRAGRRGPATTVAVEPLASLGARPRHAGRPRRSWPRRSSASPIGPRRRPTALEALGDRRRARRADEPARRAESRFEGLPEVEPGDAARGADRAARSRVRAPSSRPATSWPSRRRSSRRPRAGSRDLADGRARRTRQRAGRAAGQGPARSSSWCWARARTCVRAERGRADRRDAERAGSARTPASTRRTSRARSA